MLCTRRIELIVEKNSIKVLYVCYEYCVVMTTTFEVDPVEVNDERCETADCAMQIQTRLKNESIEAAIDARIVADTKRMHGFVATIGYAYDYHYPVSLAPVHVWQLITQGVAAFIEKNAERLRNTFVDHEGKALIEIRRDEFRKGQRNDWKGVLSEFISRIKSQIKMDMSMMVRPFSSTTDDEVASLHVTLMDAMKEYFEYKLTTRCGIPKITLEGSLNDWRDLHARVVHLSTLISDDFFQTWLSKIQRITTHFVQAAEGNADTKFWRHFFKRIDGSGGPWITGWINDFFPYHKTDLMHVQDIPSGLSSAPFLWQYFETVYKMRFTSGFFGATQMEDGCLRPLIGWAVIDEEETSSLKAQLEFQTRVEQHNIKFRQAFWGLRSKLSTTVCTSEFRNDLKKRLDQAEQIFLIQEFGRDSGRRILSEIDFESREKQDSEFETFKKSFLDDLSKASKKTQLASISLIAYPWGGGGSLCEL